LKKRLEVPAPGGLVAKPGKSVLTLTAAALAVLRSAGVPIAATPTAMSLLAASPGLSAAASTASSTAASCRNERNRAAYGEGTEAGRAGERGGSRSEGGTLRWSCRTADTGGEKRSGLAPRSGSNISETPAARERGEPGEVGER
jgi:hypothetical protein